MTTLQQNERPASQPYKIVIAVAFDSTADAALKEGVRLAAGHPGAELHVVHVSGKPKPLDSTRTLIPTADGPEDPADTLRRRIEAAWQDAGELQVIAHIRSGQPATEILQAAIDIGSDIIVVGTHRRSGVKKLVLGSVAEQVLHAAHCPVLIVVAKDYSGTVATPTVDPPCAECLAMRKATANATFWCERHSKTYREPHIYVPRDQSRSSVFPAL